MTLATAICLLVSCSAPDGSDAGAESDRTVATPTTPSRQDASRPPSPTGHPEQSMGPIPSAPATHDAIALAHQLDRAAGTLRSRDAAASEVRSAAQFHQLAVRVLATAPAAFSRKVTSLVDRRTARITRSDVRAATLLHAMGEPQPQLPRWRIVAPIPATKLLGYYKRAQGRTGVRWSFLAAIHLVETRMGRIRGTSTAGARGPMQFLPSTWDLYGAGGDINDPRDAILAAARLLKDHGAPRDMADALWHYNPSDNYVRAVMEYARNLQRSPSLYRGYWHWRVLYRHVRGTFVLPVGYPEKRPVPLSGR